jgi:hypothetical protein
MIVTATARAIDTVCSRVVKTNRERHEADEKGSSLVSSAWNWYDDLWLASGGTNDGIIQSCEVGGESSPVDRGAISLFILGYQ